MKAVALMGATGTGKSAAALELAHAHGTGIISCDSMQVYKGLDIGTAKPGKEEQAQVPHYLIDNVELPAICSAASWAADAARIIARENEAGRRPLITGGTGLYLKALLEGFADIPADDPVVKERLLAEAESFGIEALHARLAEVDAEIANRLKSGDTQRIVRALSVYESTGKTLSEWHAQGPDVPEIDCPVFVLEVPREQLRERLATRFEAMMAAGWLDEVKWLSGFNLPDTHPATRAVGYRQLLNHLADPGYALADAVRDGITATRQYAKRQQTWFAHQTPDAVRGDAAMLRPCIAGLLAQGLESQA